MDNQKTILIVDDSEDMRFALEAILKQKYKTILACDGLEAVEEFKKQKIDLIMMDNAMPKMNGLEAIKEIRKTDQAIPIILITGDFEIQSKPSGVNKLVRKIFNTETILSAISSLLRA